MIVLKFGGTSVGSASSVLTLLGILEEYKESAEKPVVVLSAMSGVTNLLIEMAERSAAGESVGEQLGELEKRHFDTVKELLEVHRQNPVLTKLKLLFNELEDLLQGVSSLKELTLQTRDLILSFGERCSTIMVSKVAEQYLGDSVFLDTREVVKTDSNFGQARIIQETTDLLVTAFCREHSGKFIFATGFIASNAGERTTTLGRGGSDYTAAIIGAALNASAIQIWTDVNGMMTADPRLVKKAFSLPELSYTEAMELSFFGAKVIYPPTMIPAFMKKIPIVILNTFDTTFAGTVIRHDCHSSNLPVKGISSINHISVINIQGSGMVGKAGFSGRLFSLLAREQINVILITQSSSEHSITFAVNPAEAERAKKLIAVEFELELHARKIEEPQVEEDLSVLAIVGENMKRTPGISGKLFHALGRNGINVRAIAQGSSEYNISVIISRHDMAKALNAVHEAFFTDLKKTLNIFCLGTGNIGSTLFRQLSEHREFLEQNNGISVRIAGISNTRKMVFDDPDNYQNGLSPDNWKELLEASETPADLAGFVARMKEMNLPNCVFVDNTASARPVDFYENIFRSNISIVTCNKIGNSGTYRQYRLFKDTAHDYGVDFFYETNVGAGLPIVRTLRDLMVSGDRILKIEAILSGTISFIFNNFNGDASFFDVVKTAQEKGYTEPDPRDDLRGTDFMRKLLILARDAGHPLEPADVEIDPILPQACLDAATVDDFYRELQLADNYFNDLKQRAGKDGKVLRYIGILDNGKAKISLEMVDEKHPFFTMSGSDNIIAFTTDRYKDRPMVVKGPGAGAEVTAAGVFADIINVGAK
jgi:aspartokinase/homoserine dehydrogenase 1